MSRVPASRPRPVPTDEPKAAVRRRVARASVERSSVPSPEADAGVSALRRGFDVLDCFVAARAPLGNGDVATATGIPRATCSRLIATLVSLGHLRPAAEHDRYELAAGVVRLAQAFLGAIDVRHFARPRVEAVCAATGLSSFVGVRDGDDMLVVEGAKARGATLLLGADIGTRMFIPTSALGRAWLAAIDVPAADALVARWRHDARRDPVLAKALGAPLDRALAAARRDGVARSLGEWHPGIHAVAVPVRTASGDVVSLNCGGPAALLPAGRLDAAIVPRLVEAAHALATEIGGAAGVDAMPRVVAPSRRSQSSVEGRPR